MLLQGEWLKWQRLEQQLCILMASNGRKRKHLTKTADNTPTHFLS